MQNKKQFIGRRAQMAFVGVGLWVLLMLWSVSAFFAHIDELQESYQLAAKAGALAGEFALLALVLWHCFDKHIGVRRWSLILGFILAGVILVHTGALRGLKDARIQQRATEDRLTEKLGELSKQQTEANSKASSEIARQMKSSRQRERLWVMNRQIQTGAESNVEAQRLLANEIALSNDKVKNSSILPRWWLDGYMYSGIFIISLLFVGVIFLLMMNEEDIDANYDGIPDREQLLLPAQRSRFQPLAGGEHVRVNARQPLVRTRMPARQATAQSLVTEGGRTTGTGRQRVVRVDGSD